MVTPTDREDLFAEARNLEPRFQLASPPDGPFAAPIVIGQPKARTLAGQGERGIKFYLGPDFMVGLNAQGELRRHFADGYLFRAEPGRKLIRIDNRHLEPASAGPHPERIRHTRELSAAEVTLLCEGIASQTERLNGLLKSEPTHERIYPESASPDLLMHMAQLLERATARGLIVADGM